MGGPKFEGAVDQRRFRILNALFMALCKRGHNGEAHERDGEIHTSAIIGDTHVSLELGLAGKHGRARAYYGQIRPEPDLPAKTPLILRADSSSKGTASEWQDDASGTLETKIAAMAAAIVLAGEAKFRRGFREAEEWAEKQRIEEEKQRQEEIAARNRQRLHDLRMSGDLLRQAEDIRALVTRVRKAMVGRSVDVDEVTLQAWGQWALTEADKIDPVRSGQIMTHLRAPSP
jgi:hypothetical protein